MSVTTADWSTPLDTSPGPPEPSPRTLWSSGPRVATRSSEMMGYGFTEGLDVGPSAHVVTSPRDQSHRDDETFVRPAPAVPPMASAAVSPILFRDLIRRAPGRPHFQDVDRRAARGAIALWARTPDPGFRPPRPGAPTPRGLTP